MSVEDQFGGGTLVAVGPGSLLPRVGGVVGGVEVNFEVVARQPRGHAAPLRRSRAGKKEQNEQEESVPGGRHWGVPWPCRQRWRSRSIRQPVGIIDRPARASSRCHVKGGDLGSTAGGL